MAVNKVMDSVGNVLIDLTSDTVTADKVLQGYTFHDKAGNAQIGTVQTTHSGVVGNYKEDNVVRFIDYDGTIVAEYSIAEANALQALPTPPTPTDVDFLVFDGWNHTLQEVQETTHSLLVGALYDTIDHKAYFKANILSLSNFSFYTYAKSQGASVSIDWGDGNTETVSVSANNSKYTSHAYAQRGVYWIKVELLNGSLRQCTPSSNSTTLFITEEYIGNNANGAGLSGNYSQSVCIRTYGKDVLTVQGLAYAYKLRAFILPRGCTLPDSNFLWNTELLRYLSFPRTVTNDFNLNNVTISQRFLLESIILPENCTLIGNTFTIPNNTKYFYMNGEGPQTITLSSKFIENIVFPNPRSQYETASLEIYDISLKELHIPSGIKTLHLGPIGAKEVFIPSTVQKIAIGVSSSNGDNVGTKLEILDLTAFETPPTLLNTYITGFFKIKVAPGTISLYQNATNWSTVYSYGMIEEATTS